MNSGSVHDGTHSEGFADAAAIMYAFEDVFEDEEPPTTTNARVSPTVATLCLHVPPRRTTWSVLVPRSANLAQSTMLSTDPVR